MDIFKMKALSYDEMRSLYREFLHSQNISKLTINTAYADTFYLWRKGSKDLFWNAVTDTDFENIARNELIKALSENSTGNAKSLANSYLSHLRRFRLFLLLMEPPSHLHLSKKRLLIENILVKRKWTSMFLIHQ